MAGLVFGLVSALSANAEGEQTNFHSFTAPALEGGLLALEQFEGKAVLVVNTASLCGFTPQYSALQNLHETYEDQGFAVLAVPSNSFRQELSSSEDVAEFCDVQFGLTFPMTDILPVTGRNAHDLFQWLADEGARPRWNFHKFLIAADGSLVRDWPSQVSPDNPRLRGTIEAHLPSG
ncbi:MAG: glutathione peroxidase [Pseudomonadota bacterium]